MTESYAVKKIKQAIPKHLKSDMLGFSKGFSCELYKSRVFPKHYMAAAVDGVGTKLILAQALNRYDTIGIDLVAMSANDLCTIPNISPYMFINYIAAQTGFLEKAEEVMKGIVKGLREACTNEIFRNDIRLTIGKGETACVDELLSGIRPGSGFDIAGSMLGFVKKRDLRIPKLSDGDIIIALKSSGPHSNGYTDLRHCLLKGEFEKRREFKKLYKGRFKLADMYDWKTIGEWLIEPTIIYSKIMARISQKCRVIGINNTGYGLKNLNRINQDIQFIITDPIKPQPIFDLMQKESKFSDKHMYEKFNMGMGFFILCKRKDARQILKLIGFSGKIVGEIRKEKKKVILIKDNKKIEFVGY